MKHLTTDKLLSLGMALHADKRTMETRVRSIFARRHSAWFASLAAVVLCSAIGVLGFTTACQPAEEEVQQAEVPVQAEILSVTQESGTIIETALPTLPTEPFTTPERLTYTLDSVHDNVSITVDADVVVPELTDVAIQKIENRAFTQADADIMFKAFVGDADFVTLDSRTDAASKELKFTTSMINILWHYGPEIKTADGGITSEWTEDAIAAATANGNGAVIGRFKNKNGEWMKLNIVNECYGENGSKRSYARFGMAFDAEHTIPKPSDKPYTLEQAIQDADALIAELAPGYVLVGTEAGTSYYDAVSDNSEHSEHGYRLTYRPGAAPSAACKLLDPGEEQWLLAAGTQMPAMGRIPFQSANGEILLVFDAEGVLYFDWGAPKQVFEETAQATLLSFSEIQRIVDDFLVNTLRPHFPLLDATEGDYRVRINRYELGWQIVENASGSTYRPVWHICGGVTGTEAESGNSGSVGRTEPFADENCSALLLIDAVTGEMLVQN